MYPVRSLARPPEAGESHRDLGGATSNGMYIFGLVIFVFGFAFLLRNLGIIYFPGSFWSLFYPLIIVGFGLVVICITHEGRKLLKKIKEWLDWSKKVK